MTADDAPADPWGMPTAVQVLDAGAARDAWLRERAAGLGGSDMPLLMGVANPNHGSEFTLWQEKTGRAPDVEPTHAMTRGTWLEPHLAEVFAEQQRMQVREFGLCVSTEDKIMRYTPDRFTADGGILEIKSMNNYAQVRHEWRGGGVSRAADVQGQWGLLVTGRAPLWLLGYEVDHAPAIRGPFAPDRELHARMRARARQWWDDHVVTDTPPAVDLSSITDDEIAARWPTLTGDMIEAPFPAYVAMMLAEREQVHAQEKQAAARKREIDTALRVMAGDASGLTVDGQPVVTWSQFAGRTVVDPAMEWEMPEVWEQYVTRSQQRRVNIVKRK